MRRTGLILFLLLLVNTLSVFAEWERSITNYSLQTYKAANQNWKITQHQNGWMYFANNKGLLEYDGTTWNTYPINNAKTRAVKAGNDNRIYIGGLGQFGYYVPDNLGGLEYHCLSDSLGSTNDRCNIWNIHTIDDRVYFQTDNSVFYHEKEKTIRIPFETGITFSGVVNNRLYICSGDGIYFLNGNEFTLIPKTEYSIKSKVVGLFPYKDQLLIVTSYHGIFLYDGIKMREMQLPADSLLKNNRLFCSAKNDSLLAMGTVQDGVLLMNIQTGEIEKISINNGLQNKTVLSMLFDRENNLWLGLDNGIDCINLNAPAYFLYSKKNEIGAGYSSSLYNGNLYLGTNQGLYKTMYPVRLDDKTILDFVPGTGEQIWSILEYDNKLFCGGSSSLTVIDENKTYKINGVSGIWSVQPLKNHPDKLIVGTYFGLCVLKKNKDSWTFSHTVENVNQSAKNMYVEDITNAIWISNKEKGLFRIKLSPDLQSGEVQNFNSESLPAGDNVGISKVNNEIVIASRKGIFRYNQVKDVLQKHTELELILDGNNSYTHIMQDTFGNIWYTTQNMLKIARYQPAENNWRKNEGEFYLNGRLFEDFENIRLISENEALIGTEEGYCLLQFDKMIEKKYPLNLQIRKVYLTMGKDSLIYGRSYVYADQDIQIPYTYNSVKIEYSVNNYNKSLGTLFSYRLEGSDFNEWSEYSENNTKEYTNLREGKYTFHVKLITDGDNNPINTSFVFEILPPWYRTWWAYFFYLLLAITTIIVLSKKHQHLIIQKNQEIIRQNARYIQENALKDKKIDSLKEKNLQSDLKYKSDELVKTTMNIVRKNEMLQAIRKEAVSISRSVEEENLSNIRRKMIRLISHIDTNIEHDDDMNAFQTSFDSLHQDFFEKLDRQFPGLNKKDKLLCAYIKMDLMSKEIAPLLNISLRGVEISRYRLRKKLQLSTEDNLAEFLQRL